MEGINARKAADGGSIFINFRICILLYKIYLHPRAKKNQSSRTFMPSSEGFYLLSTEHTSDDDMEIFLHHILGHSHADVPSSEDFL
jgi:hypothetical protein